MVATLNQPQYQPWPMEEQVVAIYAGINGFLDDIPVVDVSRFQDELREYLRTEGTLYKEIRETGDLPDELAERLDKELETFKESFNPSQETALVGAAS
jgi:F-type H+-transporting ATPase subunit alpha